MYQERAVVGDDQPVALQRPQNDKRLTMVAGEAEAGLQAQTQPHRRQVGIGAGGGEVGGRMDVAALGLLDGDAQGVVDLPGLHFRVAASSGKMGRPAASAEVQPSGRSALLRRLNTAPEPACQPAP